MIQSKVFGNYSPIDEGYIEKGKSQTNPDEATHRINMMGAIMSGKEVNTNRMKQHDGASHVPDFSQMDYSTFFDYCDRVEDAVKETATLKKVELAKAAKVKADKAMDDLKNAAIEEYKKSISSSKP